MAEHVSNLTYRTLGYLIYLYQLTSNPIWTDLPSHTRADYEEVFQWLAPFYDLQIGEVDPTLLDHIRNLALERRDWHFAIQVFQVIGALVTWKIQKYSQINRPAPAEEVGTSLKGHSETLPFRLYEPGTRKNNPFYVARGCHPVNRKSIEISTRTRVRHMTEAFARDYWHALSEDNTSTMPHSGADFESSRAAPQGGPAIL